MRWERYGILYIKKKKTVILSSTVSGNQGWNNGFLLYTVGEIDCIIVDKNILVFLLFWHLYNRTHSKRHLVMEEHQIKSQ